jgi:hypothetical protein
LTHDLEPNDRLGSSDIFFDHVVLAWDCIFHNPPPKLNARQSSAAPADALTTVGNLEKVLLGDLGHRLVLCDVQPGGEEVQGVLNGGCRY